MNQKLKCPDCQHEIEVSLESVIPASQVLHMELESHSEFFSADSIGRAISSMAAIQTGVAKNLGSEVAVFIKSIEVTPGKMRIGFLITNNSSQHDLEGRSKTPYEIALDVLASEDAPLNVTMALKEHGNHCVPCMVYLEHGQGDLCVNGKIILMKEIDSKEKYL